VTAYVIGRLAWADGMLLEDYMDAIAFRDGIPKATHWVDELREQAMAASFNALM
jgi:hypothetical protein